MDHLSGNGLEQSLCTRQPLETRGAEQRRLGDFERAPLIDQALPLLLEGLQLITGKCSPNTRGERAGQ